MPSMPEAAVLFDQRHGVGVRGEQHLFVLRRAVVLARQIRDDRLAGVALEAGGQRQRGRLAGLRVRQHLRAVHAIERERGTVDVVRAESRLAVRRVDAALRQPERRARRQVVDDDDARRAALDADRGKSVQLTPDPAGMIGAGDARRRRREQRRPLARRAPLVVGQRVVVQERIRSTADSGRARSGRRESSRRCPRRPADARDRSTASAR